MTVAHHPGNRADLIGYGKDCLIRPLRSAVETAGKKKRMPAKAPAKPERPAKGAEKGEKPGRRQGGKPAQPSGRTGRAANRGSGPNRGRR